MENATTRTNRPSSNISEMVSKFAKVCKLRSIGVFSNEDPNLNQKHYHPNPGDNDNTQLMCEDGSDATEEMECDGEKVHPQPVVVPSERHRRGGGDIFLELFDVVSALKLAYIQLQEAHVPYDPDKIVAADELVVAKLEAVCKFKRTIKEKQFTKFVHESSRFDCLRAEIKVNEKLLRKLKSESKAKEEEIMRLRQELCDLDARNANLMEKMRRISLERKNIRILNIDVFKDIFRKASNSIHDFAKPVITLMKASGWNLDQAVNSIENGVVYSKSSHKKYAFEAYIARRMFQGIPLRPYNVYDVLRFDDPIDSLMVNPNSGFANFCAKKYLFVVHPEMEMSFFGNLDQRMFLLGGKHPRTAFYQVFARMAKWIWVVQGIATSIDSNAKIFAVKRGSKFSRIYMESVEEFREGAIASDGENSNQRVELMIMPGFRIGDTLVRSHVYASEVKPPLRRS